MMNFTKLGVFSRVACSVVSGGISTIGRRLLVRLRGVAHWGGLAVWGLSVGLSIWLRGIDWHSSIAWLRRVHLWLLISWHHHGRLLHHHRLLLHHGLSHGVLLPSMHWWEHVLCYLPKYSCLFVRHFFVWGSAHAVGCIRCLRISSLNFYFTSKASMLA